MSAQNEQERLRLGSEVARSRSKRAWTQDDLAEKAGLGRRTVVDVERGMKVRERTLRKIEQAFGWPLESAEDVGRGVIPNPDDKRELPIGLPPIEATEAGQANDAEFNELVKTTLEQLTSVRRHLGNDVAELTIKRLIEAADKRGDHDVANTLRRII